jgi:hypothetical protein
VAERIQTAREERGWFSPPAGVAILWSGILAGPVAWALDLTVSYSLVKWTCSSQHTSVLHLITAAAVLMTAAGAAASWYALHQAPDDAVDDGARPVDRGRFMAILGLVLCALFALAMIGDAVPRLLLDACV